MGYRVHTYSPDDDTPTGQVADLEVVGSYDDLAAVRRFAQAVDVVTFEFENVPSATTGAAAKVAPVRPDGHVLHITQHRLREKTFLRDHGFPLANFDVVRSLDELRAALAKIGMPAVLKTAGWGYDGKGQSTIRSIDQAESAWASLATSEAVLEAFVDFEKEISVVAARSQAGEFCHWGVIENHHVNHILDTSFCPAAIDRAVYDQAIGIARGILESLAVVGVLCVEFFLCRDGTLKVNELAPRPHNSGHLTYDSHVTSQFEQQVRAVCNLPLGSTELLRPAAMANLLGDLWRDGEPNWPAALASDANVKLHLYGKAEPRPGRKMGHLTALADTADQALVAAKAARAAAVKPS